MIKHQIFVNKHVLPQTQRINIIKRFLICSNLSTKILQQYHWHNSSVVIITFQQDISYFASPCFYQLFRMLNCVTYTEAETQKAAPHLIELLSRIFKKLQINHFSKPFLDGYFKLKSDISLKSVPQQGCKIRKKNHVTKHQKICFSFMISIILTKAGS